MGRFGERESRAEHTCPVYSDLAASSVPNGRDTSFTEDISGEVQIWEYGALLWFLADVILLGSLGCSLCGFRRSGDMTDSAGLEGVVHLLG